MRKARLEVVRRLLGAPPLLDDACPACGDAVALLLFPMKDGPADAGIASCAACGCRFVTLAGWQRLRALDGDALDALGGDDGPDAP